MNFLTKMSLEFKLFLGFIASMASMALFFFIRGKLRARDKMNFELKKLESELKIVELEKDSVNKEKELSVLKEREILIREKLKVLDEMEKVQGKEVSLEELDDFFDKRIKK